MNNSGFCIRVVDSVVDLITTKANFVAGFAYGCIDMWDGRNFKSEQPRMFLTGHRGAILSPSTVSGHLLSLDESGMIIMWSGYELENKNAKARMRVGRGFLQRGVFGWSYEYERRFASIPRLVAKDSCNVDSWYKRWFGFAGASERSSSPEQATTVRIWSLPDL